MRKGLCLLLAAFVITSPSFAFLKLGIKAGVNLADVSASNTSVDYKMKPGIVGGLSAEVPVSTGGGLSVRGELLYEQKGAKFTLLNESGKITTDELVVAPFLVLKFGEHVTPFLEAGPEFGFNTLAKSEQNGQTASFGPHWKKQNFSLNVGGGVELPFGKNDITLDLRYNLGLVDMTVGEGNVKTKTNGIQALIGFNFLQF